MLNLRGTCNHTTHLGPDECCCEDELPAGVCVPLSSVSLCTLRRDLPLHPLTLLNT